MMEPLNGYKSRPIALVLNKISRMSQSFRISGGDLVLQNRSFATVDGQDKLFQDLSLMLEEPLGTDSLAPTYGSSLDNEIINGQEVSPFIGQVFNSQIAASIVGEVRRVLSNYQQAQLQKMQQEAIQFQGRTTLNDSEIIYSIDSINISNSGMIVLVQVSLTTLAGISVKLTFPVTP